MKKGIHKNLLILIAYTITHITNAIFNRVVMAKFFFNFPLFISILQFGILLFIIEVASSQNIIKLQPYTLERGKELMIPSLLFSISTYFSLISLDGVNLHMFPLMTKLAPIFAVGIIFFFSEDRDTLTTGKIVVIGLIVLFSSMSVYFFYSFQPMSWFYGLFVGMFLPYSFRLFYLQAEKSNIKDVIYVNCFNCFGLFMIADLFLNEIKYVYYYYQTSASILFYISIMMQVITGIFSYILLMYIVKKLGLITTTVTYTALQSLQLFFAYLFSLILFYDVTPTFFNILNIWLCTITTIYYFIRYCKNIPLLDKSTFKYIVSSNKR